MFPDNDKNGKRTFLDIARYLNTHYEIKAKLVELPEDALPLKWDLADEIPNHLNVASLILNAKVPEPLAEYEDIRTDIVTKRFVYIKES